MEEEFGELEAIYGSPESTAQDAHEPQANASIHAVEHTEGPVPDARPAPTRTREPQSARLNPIAQQQSGVNVTTVQGQQSREASNTQSVEDELDELKVRMLERNSSIKL